MINVTFVYPPIPDRRFDYSATWSGYDEGDPIGYGETPAEAINDLLEQSDGGNDEADLLKAELSRLAMAISPLLTGFKFELLTPEQQDVVSRGVFAARSVWHDYQTKPKPHAAKAEGASQ